MKTKKPNYKLCSQFVSYVNAGDALDRKIKRRTPKISGHDIWNICRSVECKNNRTQVVITLSYFPEITGFWSRLLFKYLGLFPKPKFSEMVENRQEAFFSDANVLESNSTVLTEDELRDFIGKSMRRFSSLR